MVTAIWLIYIVMFAKFIYLFRKSEGALDSIRCQLVTFFATVIGLLTIRLGMHWFFFANDLKDSMVSFYHNQDSNRVFWIRVCQVFIVIVESLFNVIVVYNLIDNVRN
jgi:ABC-type Co2+ transport system permease subunit